jgi:hypothetical protein
MILQNRTGFWFKEISGKSGGNNNKRINKTVSKKEKDNCQESQLEFATYPPKKVQLTVRDAEFWKEGV